MQKRPDMIYRPYITLSNGVAAARQWFPQRRQQTRIMRRNPRVLVASGGRNERWSVALKPLNSGDCRLPLPLRREGPSSRGPSPLLNATNPRSTDHECQPKHNDRELHRPVHRGPAAWGRSLGCETPLGEGDRPARHGAYPIALQPAGWAGAAGSTSRAGTHPKISIPSGVGGLRGEWPFS